MKYICVDCVIELNLNIQEDFLIYFSGLCNVCGQFKTRVGDIEKVYRIVN